MRLAKHGWKMVRGSSARTYSPEGCDRIQYKIYREGPHPTHHILELFNDGAWVNYWVVDTVDEVLAVVGE